MKKPSVIKIGKRGKESFKMVLLGGNHPIAIQSMCNTKTFNVKKTIAQILSLEREGCEMVRVAVPDKSSALALKEIKKQIHIPLIADIHFDPDLALLAIKNGADKIRINPGNIAINSKNSKKLEEIITAARITKIPIRIGVNSGALETSLIDKFGGPTSQALVESALKWIKYFESKNFNALVISIKSTDVETTIEANELLYKKMAERAKKSKKPIYPIHLGVTEAGPLISASVRSSIALGHLLRKGIGNTIRISLTEDPVLGVKVAKELLKSLGLYSKEPFLISCPTCGRTEIDLKSLVKKVEKEIEKLSRANFFSKLAKKSPSSKPLKLAIVGCIVNGPGEAREADLAICGGKGFGAIYKKGKFVKSIPEKDLVKEFIKLIKKTCIIL